MNKAIRPYQAWCDISRLQVITVGTANTVSSGGISEDLLTRKHTHTYQSVSPLLLPSLCHLKVLSVKGAAGSLPGVVSCQVLVASIVEQNPAGPEFRSQIPLEIAIELDLVPNQM